MEISKAGQGFQVYAEGDFVKVENMPSTLSKSEALLLAVLLVNTTDKSPDLGAFKSMLLSAPVLG